jgi:murein DD-endopeptidase MepM/ murein hydrolase activator NlpD
MQIVFLSKSHSGSFRFKVGAIGLLAAMALLSGAGYAAYHAGVRAGTSDAETRMQARVEAQAPVWQQRIDEQRAALEGLNENLHLNINALAVRMGEMQAHVARLNALGERLAGMAKLPSGEFDFSATPAAGGPAPTVPASSDITDIASAFQTLSREIDDRSEKLSALEAMLLSRDLDQQTSPTGRPLRGGWVSSTYGNRVDPITGRREFHSGIDFVGPANSKVVALAAGVVSWSGPRSEYGNVVEVNHGDGVVTRYAHNKENLVRQGDKVEKGQAIAVMGSTGRVTGPHVHFEVIRDGVIVDPVDYIKSAKDASRSTPKQDS